MTGPDERTMAVYVTNAVRCSDGNYIGWHELPIAEANALIANRRASTTDPADVHNRELARTVGLTAPRSPA